MSKFIKVLGNRGRVTIPVEIRREVGFAYNDVLSFEVTEDNGVIIRKEKVCECSSAPEEKQETLLDFLNNLSPEQQAAALVHLSMQMAEKQGERQNAR